jgi:O-antigen/teichoic acid export membrane protein
VLARCVAYERQQTPGVLDAECDHSRGGRTAKLVWHITHLPKRLTHNTAVKLASEVIGRAASFALTIVAARQLGESGFGLYNYGLAFGFVLAQLADMGLQMLVAREVAINDRAAQPLARMAFHLKCGLSALVVALLGGLILLQPASARPALLLLGLMQIDHTYLELLAYVYRGQQALAQEAWLLGGARVSMAVVGTMILWQGGGVAQLAAGHLLVTLLVTVLGIGRLRRAGWLRDLGRRVQRVEVSHLPGLGSYALLLRQAAPLGVAIFLSIAYTRSAVLLLQYRMGETAVAHFSAAARLVEPTQILPASLMAAVFPAISLALANDPKGARALGMRISLLLGGCGLGLAALFWLSAKSLTLWLYGEPYMAAAPVLQWLGLTTVLAFVNYSLTHYLIARQQQAYLGLFTGGMLTLHLALSWWLIGWVGVVGPAISVLASEAFLFSACLLLLARPKVTTQAMAR